MQSIDLFSCVGCHALGFRRAGIETIRFVEINPARREVLRSHFPNIPAHDDVTTYKPEPADIVVGGPPCQRTSVGAAISGKRTGQTLWPVMRRIAQKSGAFWVVVEQPPGNARWERKVGRDLRADGYHVARVEFSAFDVGAPYLRRRVFVIACASLPRLAFAWASVPSEIKRVKGSAAARGSWNPSQLSTLRVDAKSAGEMDGPGADLASATRKERIEALGDSNPPEMAEVIARAIVRAEQEELP